MVITGTRDDVAPAGCLHGCARTPLYVAAARCITVTLRRVIYYNPFVLVRSSSSGSGLFFPPAPTLFSLRFAVGLVRYASGVLPAYRSPAVQPVGWDWTGGPVGTVLICW